eukprot:64592_1
MNEHKWAKIIRILNPNGCYKHSCIATSIFGVNALTLGCFTIINHEFMLKTLQLNVSNASKILMQMNGIASFNMGSYYLYMAYHRVSTFFEITIPFRMFVTFGVISYSSFKYSNKYLLMIALWELGGALHSLAALKYDEYAYKQVLATPMIHNNMNDMCYDYKLQITVGDPDYKQKYFEYFLSASNLVSNHPLLTQLEYRDITSRLVDDSTNSDIQYLYLDCNDNINRVSVKYNAILQFDRRKHEITAYCYAWPETYIINFYQFQTDAHNLYFVQKTRIKTMFGLKWFVLKKAKDAHTKAIQAMKQHIEAQQ